LLMLQFQLSRRSLKPGQHYRSNI